MEYKSRDYYINELNKLSIKKLAEITKDISKTNKIIKKEVKQTKED